VARDFVSFDLGELSASQTYDLLVGTVQPRPIAFVSTISGQGQPNLAPYSFFMVGGVNPPSLMFCPTIGPRGTPKDSLRNIQETAEFVVNLVTREMADGMNATSYAYPHGFDEWQVSNFTNISSDIVQPPRVLESPVAFECKLFTVVQHGEGASAACYVIGEIVRAHLHENLWQNGAFVQGAFNPISRLGGPNYLDMEAMEVFSMARPSRAPESSVEA
jgi:flavin reductase (DIM6/NTAB) family NADH-FMN oxidoreductase RutF